MTLTDDDRSDGATGAPSVAKDMEVYGITSLQVGVVRYGECRTTLTDDVAQAKRRGRSKDPAP